MKDPATTILHADVLETLARVRRERRPVAAVILDPPYNVGAGGVRRDYLPWLLRVIRASARVADHVFVWGFPPTIAAVLMRVPTTLRLKAWLTWAYTNVPTSVRGWKPAQQACLHLVRRGARMHPGNFFTDEQRRRFEAGTLRYPPSPPSVISSGSLVGWAGKAEKTGHPAQKPEKVIEPLILMSTVPGDLVVDPMAGSGTTGVVCQRLGRRAILGDSDEGHVERMEKRLRVARATDVNLATRRRTREEPTEARRREGVRLVQEERLTLAEAARRVGASRESVRRWVAALRAGDSLTARPRQGGVPKLDRVEEARLVRASRAGKLRGSLAEVATQIEGLTGVRFSRGHVSRLLEKLGIERARRSLRDEAPPGA